MLLAGKKVIVVGGSSGIGLATTELAKKEGAEVVVASRNAERLKAAANKIGATGIPADVTSDESVADLFRKCGLVDHVVVTAAQRAGPFKTVAMDDVRATMESKILGRLASCAVGCPSPPCDGLSQHPSTARRRDRRRGQRCT
jgi:NAD(P)-dependent dehydrogenase (short-subunit alcohol dehydrogenase family)